MDILSAVAAAVQAIASVALAAAVVAQKEPG